MAWQAAVCITGVGGGWNLYASFSPSYPQSWFLAPRDSMEAGPATCTCSHSKALSLAGLLPGRRNRHACHINHRSLLPLHPSLPTNSLCFQGLWTGRLSLDLTPSPAHCPGQGLFAPPRQASTQACEPVGLREDEVSSMFSYSAP